MGTDLANLWSESAGSSRTVWLTAAILLLTLILGVSGSFASVDGVERGNDAYAARYQAMAESYEANAERGIDAAAARYGAMAEFLLASAGDDLLASNPELKLARAGYGQAYGGSGDLAINPELRLARTGYAQDFQVLGSCSPAEDGAMAANPELRLARSAGAC